MYTLHYKLNWCLCFQLHLLRSRRNNFSFELRTIQYPNPKTAPKWRKLFKECASQRLFLPVCLHCMGNALFICADGFPYRTFYGKWTRFCTLTPTFFSYHLWSKFGPTLGEWTLAKWLPCLMKVKSFLTVGTIDLRSILTTAAMASIRASCWWISLECANLDGQTDWILFWSSTGVKLYGVIKT